jgi:hypothetical protein
MPMQAPAHLTEAEAEARALALYLKANREAAAVPELVEALTYALAFALPEDEEGPHRYPSTLAEWTDLRRVLRAALAKVGV